MSNLISTHTSLETRASISPSYEERAISLIDALLISMNVLSLLENGQVVGIHKDQCTLLVDTRYRWLRDYSEAVVNLIDKTFKNCLVLSANKLNLTEDVKWKVIHLESFYEKALVGAATLRMTYATPDERDSEAEGSLAIGLNIYFIALKSIMGWSDKNIEELYRRVKNEVIIPIPDAPPYIEESEMGGLSLLNLNEKSNEQIEQQPGLMSVVKRNRYGSDTKNRFFITPEQLLNVKLKPIASPIHRSCEFDEIRSFESAYIKSFKGNNSSSLETKKYNDLGNGRHTNYRPLHGLPCISDRVRDILKSPQFHSLRKQRESCEESRSLASAKPITPGLNSLAVSELVIKESSNYLKRRE